MTLQLTHGIGRIFKADLSELTGFVKKLFQQFFTPSFTITTHFKKGLLIIACFTDMAQRVDLLFIHPQIRHLMNIIERPNKAGNKITFYYDFGRALGQRPTTGIFIYTKPKNQVEKNHNKEALALLEVKKSQLTIEQQAVGSAEMKEVVNQILQHEYNDGLSHIYVESKILELLTLAIKKISTENKKAVIINEVDRKNIEQVKVWLD